MTPTASQQTLTGNLGSPDKVQCPDWMLWDVGLTEEEWLSYEP